MQQLIKSWLKYFIFVGFFGVCMNLIYLALPVYMMVVYDKVLFSFSRATLYSLSVGVLISLLFMGVMDYVRMRIQVQAGNSLVQKMTPFVLKSMHQDAVAIHQQPGSQGYAHGLQDLELLRNAIVRGYLFYILDLPWVLFYLGVLYFMHPLVGVVAIAGILMVIFFQVLLRILEKKRYVLADLAFRTNNTFFKTCLGHAGLISGMGMLPAVMGKYKNQYGKIIAEKSEADVFHSLASAFIRWVHLTTLAAVFGAGVFVFFTDQITAGVIFASVVIIARIFYPFERNLSDMKASIEAMAAYRRLKQFVNTQPVKEKLSLPEPEGKLEVEGISLALNNKTILHNISFSLAPGETLGIFGPSSVGKTSLCRILLGVWPAMAGKIRLDGADTSHWSKDELGQLQGYLPQETQLFPGTVAANISRLKEVDSEKVVAAAQKAGVHEMILKLPQGYETKIDDTGKNLSAGQRQLISLARVFYGDPKFVVLDEPHTHLDELGLRMVFHAMNNLKQDKITTVVVTDRPNLLMTMDKLLMIKDGQVAMYGPGKEVLEQLTKNQQAQQAAGV